VNRGNPGHAAFADDAGFLERPRQFDEGQPRLLWRLSVSTQGFTWWQSGFRAGAYPAFGPWYWTMVQIEYAGDSDFEVQGNVFGRPGGRATDGCSRTGHAIRTSGSGGGANSSGNGVLLVRVRERLHRDLRGHHPTMRTSGIPAPLTPEVGYYFALNQLSRLIQVIQHDHVRVDAQGVVDRRQQVVRVDGLVFGR
jgi:hypothetical protein